MVRRRLAIGTDNGLPFWAVWPNVVLRATFPAATAFPDSSLFLAALALALRVPVTGVVTGVGSRWARFASGGKRIHHVGQVLHRWSNWLSRPRFAGWLGQRMSIALPNRSLVLVESFGNHNLPLDLMLIFDILHKLTPGRIFILMDELVFHGLGQDAKEESSQRGLIAPQVAAIKIEVFLPLKGMIE